MSNISAYGGFNALMEIVGVVQADILSVGPSPPGIEGEKSGEKEV